MTPFEAKLLADSKAGKTLVASNSRTPKGNPARKTDRKATTAHNNDLGGDREYDYPVDTYPCNH